MYVCMCVCGCYVNYVNYEQYSFYFCIFFFVCDLRWFLSSNLIDGFAMMLVRCNSPVPFNDDDALYLVHRRKSFWDHLQIELSPA